MKPVAGDPLGMIRTPVEQIPPPDVTVPEPDTTTPQPTRSAGLDPELLREVQSLAERVGGLERLREVIGVLLESR
jgi:hypothetical protein